MRHELWKMDSGSQLSRMLYRSYLVSGSQLSRSLSSDAGTLGWSDPVSHDCGSFCECGPTIMPHSPAKSIFRLHVISSVHTHTWPLNMRGKSVRSVLALRIDRKGLFQGNSKVIVCCNVSRCKLGSHTGTPTLSKYLAPDREIRMIQQILHQARNITQSNSHILFRLFSPRSLKNTKNPFQTNNMWLHNRI